MLALFPSRLAFRVGLGCLAGAAAVFAPDPSHGSGGEFIPDLTPHFDRVAEFRVRDMYARQELSVAQKKRYKEVRFCVGLQSVEFRKVEVAFADGTTSRLRVKRLIKRGECTHSFPLTDRKGAPQRIKSVSLNAQANVKSGVQPIVGVFMR